MAKGFGTRGRENGLENIANGSKMREAFAAFNAKSLHEGAVKAGELPGNQFRRTMASVDNMIVDAGSVVINPLTKLAAGASDVMKKIAQMEDAAKLSPEEKVGGGAEILASAAGLDPKTAKRFGRAVTHGLRATERGADWAGEQLQNGDARFPDFAGEGVAQWDSKRKRWSVPPVLPRPDPAAHAAAMKVVHEHHIYEHGVVSEASKHALKKTIHQTAQEHAREQAHSKPNLSFRRP